ncbi:hypothetical protein AHAS_Ahas10G0101600 [Arachis hypogaea]
MLRSGSITDSPEQFQKRVLSFLEVLLMIKAIHFSQKVENGLFESLRCSYSCFCLIKGYDVTGWLFSCRLHDGLKLSFKLGICHVSTSLARDRLVEKRCLDHQAIMRQMITLLKKIHDTGVGHQDIKPANLVVTKQGQIKFINFGSAIDLQIGKNYVPNFTPFGS